ncbi:MAG: enoyl-CoA hydratase-related protein [Pseudomonadota bacterium]
MTIKTSISETVGRLTFGNPKRHNALTQEDWLAVRPLLDELVSEGARVIILSGEGPSFCAGADISEFGTVRKDAATARVYEAANVDAFAAVRACPVPTIAAIDTYCLGGGFGLAAACDLRLATPRAQFAVPPAKLGLAYPVEAIGDIVTALGEQNAKAMLFTAQRHNAQNMKEKGFLLELVQEDELLDRAHKLAQKVAKLAPLTHRATKAAIAKTPEAKTMADATFESADYAEGRAAFKEKRKPVFEGR